ncbi:16555_t:CDS:1, partial [Funneliformis caledonium]
MPKKLTLNERRSFINNLWTNGVHDINELHKITHIPKSTLYTYIRKLKNFGIIKPKSRPGRPKLLSPKKRIHLGKLASTRKCATSKEIAFTLNQAYPNFNIASRTIRENLFNLGYRVSIPTSIPMLTVAAKERRVE